MTTIHDDPFDKERIRKEADEEREAAQRKLQAQEEARARTARQHLEDEKRRLVHERDDKKRKLEELQRQVQEGERKQKETEAAVREERAAETNNAGRSADERERRILETRLARIKESLAKYAPASKEKTKEPDEAAIRTLSRNLATAKAALEKATLEHGHVIEEIKQLKRLLEQKETLEEKIKKEKDSAAATVAKLQDEKETAETEAETQRRTQRIEHEAAVRTTHARADLEKEKLKVEDQLAELDRKQKEHALDKNAHAEAARTAEAERARITTALYEFKRHIDQLTRELSLIEGKLRDIDSKLAKL